MSAPCPRDERRLYGDLAWIWETISSPESYVQESEQFAALIRRHSQIEARTLLHLGCGGGRNDYTLKKHFQVSGVDVSEGMLALARQLNPEVAYCTGDMRTLRLGKMFDSVVLFDSVSYMLTEEELRAAFETAFLHLHPGGAFVTYQEENSRTFKQNHVRHQVESKGDLEIVFIENYYDPDPTDTTIEGTFVYLIRRGGQLQIETDRHLCGILQTETWLSCLKRVGFDIKEVLETTPEEATTFACVRPR